MSNSVEGVCFVLMKTDWLRFMRLIDYMFVVFLGFVILNTPPSVPKYKVG